MTGWVGNAVEGPYVGGDPVSEHPVADGPSEAPPQGDGPGTEAAPPRRNPMPWLLVTILVALAAVLGYAVVMVVRMVA